MSHVIPIHALDTFDRLPAEGDIGYPTAYAKARAEHERRHVVAAWTPQEDAMLKRFAHEGKDALADRLLRTQSSVQQRASVLGVSLAKRAVEMAEGGGAVMSEEPPPVLPAESAPATVTFAGRAFTETEAEKRTTAEAMRRVCSRDPVHEESVVSHDEEPVSHSEYHHDLACDLEEARIQLVVYAMRDAFNITASEAETFMGQVIMPLVEAAEAAGVTHAEMEENR